MRGLIKRGLSGILVVLLVVSMMPQAAFAESADGASGSNQVAIKTQAVDGKKIADAVDKFSDAMSKLVADTSQLSKFSSFLTRFGGVTNIASGVVGILQMAGVIQDPTTAKLNQILDTVKSMEDQLKVMDKKLDALNDSLIKVQVSAEEKDRNNKADQRLKYWQDFVGKYCEPLNDKMNEYTGFVNKGIQTWWGKASHDGVNVVYTKIKNAPELTYSISKYSSGTLPKTADNGETVDANSSFAIPGSVIPNTSKMDFNINSYRTTFVNAMTSAFISAANSKKIQANATFYSNWNKLSQAAKQTQAKQYAGDILNTVIYHISCEQMSANNQWVIGVTNAYTNYCNNILQQDSGVNARLQTMYLTHGFEGEIKKDIDDFLDGMVAQAGLYGQFALTCAGQSNLQTTQNKQKIQGLFADTVNSLADKKKTALTGHDNYCYITGTVMEQDQVQATSTIKVTTESVGAGFALRGQEATDWTITVPSILDDVYSQVLYHQYQALDQGAKSFPEYLNKYGAFNDKNYTGTIMTKYVGPETFPLGDGIEMTARSYFAGEGYFSSGRKYRIDVGTGGKVEWDYYYVHDRVMVDVMDMSTGALKVNTMAGARAFYGESHGRWITDEPWMFSTDNTYVGTKTGKDGGKTVSTDRFAITLPILKLTPAHNLNGDGETNNPFFAFERTMIIDGISGQMGPMVANYKTHITSVKLSKTKFKYTGKAIKPKLTVKAGKKVVPAKYYTVKYLDNKAVGRAKVIVKGKGKYSGTHSKYFTITSNAGKALTAHAEAKMVAKGKKAVTITWPAIKKADGYDVFFARCNHHGKKVKMKKVKTISGHKKLTYTKTGLKKGVTYKARIKAFTKVKGKKKYIRTSPLLHAYTNGGTKKYTNAKSVTVKKSKVTIKKGKTYKIKATVTKLKKKKKLMPTNHARKLRYLSTNKKIATVSKAGKIKARKKGTCCIYVYAHNGVGKLIRVTVK